MTSIFNKKGVILASKIATVALTVLFGLSTMATVIAMENRTEVNMFFGQQDYDTIPCDNAANENTEYFKSDYTSVRELKNDALDLAEELVAEGAVLLKNDNALPLDENSKVSLFSISSVDPAYGGKGSAQTGSTAQAVNMKQGLEQAQLQVNPTLWNFYNNNKTKYGRDTKNINQLEQTLNDAPWSDLTADSNVNNSIAAYGDAAIVTITRVGGEGSDSLSSGYKDALDGNYLKLGNNEDSVLRGLKELKDNGTISKILVILNCSYAFETEFLYDSAYGVDAALWVGTVGQTGFNAVGDILRGIVNPSGKLSDTYWYRHADNPVMQNFGSYAYENASDYYAVIPKNSQGANPKYYSYVVYQEGIYLGYRYAETRYEDVVMGTANVGDFDYAATISHPFGYGGSYTQFVFSDYSVTKADGKYTVSVKVTNVGEVAGKEVAQIYVQKPYTAYDKTYGIEKASVELVGYAKTKLLNPNESETLTVEVDERDFTSYDANGAKTYILDEGTYYLTAAKNAHDAVNNVLAAKNYTTAHGMDANGDVSLTYETSLEFDSTTYAKSEGTNEDVTNLFDAADMNKYESKGTNAVTYLSRNNWTGTMPSTNVSFRLNDAMLAEILAQDSLDSIEKDDVEYPNYGSESQPPLYQLIDMRVDENGEKIAYNDTKWDEFMDQLSWNEIATLVSDGYHHTVGNTRITKPETYDYNGPCGLTATSYNNDKSGLAAKTSDPDGGERPVYYPGVGVITSTYNQELVLRFGEMLGEEALWAGYNGFYGIGLNTHRSAYEGRTYEYYSEDSFLAGRTAALETIGLQSHGCSAYIKHFALNDQESQRHGISVWLNEQTLREIYLKGFEMAVVEGGAHNAMAAFNRIGVTFAAGYDALLNQFLRVEAGMTGFVVSDMWQQTYSDANLPIFILEGLDIPDGTIKNVPGLFDQFKTGYGKLAWAMRESAKRILYNTVHSNAMNGYCTHTRNVSVIPQWQALAITLDVVLGVLTLSSATIATLCFVAWRKKQQ